MSTPLDTKETKEKQEADFIDDQERLFAHLHLDYRLKGSHLEGTTFKKTALYLLQHLREFQNETADIKVDAEKMEKLFADLIENELLIIKKNKEVEDAYTSWDSPKIIALEDLQKKEINPISDHFLEKLNKNNNIIIPGGWTGYKKPGHQMLYQLIKQKDGSYHFIVYNTGDGIGNHVKQKSIKDKYIPLKSFKIPSHTKPEAIKEFISQLLTPIIAPHLPKMYDKDFFRDTYSYNQAWETERIYNAKRVYQEVIDPALKKLKAEAFQDPLKAIDENPTFKVFTQGQMAGTCTMFVCKPLLKSNMGRESYHKFMIFMRLKSIQEFFEFQKKQHQLKNKMANRMLIKAMVKLQMDLENFKRRKKENIITLEKANEIQRQLSEIQAEINSIQYEKSSSFRPSRLSEKDFIEETVSESHPISRAISFIKMELNLQSSDEDSIDSRQFRLLEDRAGSLDEPTIFISRAIEYEGGQQKPSTEHQYKITFKDKKSKQIRSVLMVNPEITAFLQKHKFEEIILNKIQDQENGRRNKEEEEIVRQIYALVKKEGGDIVALSEDHILRDISEESKLASDIVPSQPLKTRDTFSNPLEFLEHSLNILRSNEAQGHSETVLHQIETLFLDFPLDSKELSEYWGNLKQEEAKKALHYLQHIMRIYGKKCYHLNPYSSAIQTITSQTGFIMAHYIMRQYCKNDKVFSDILSNFLPDRILYNNRIAPSSLDFTFDKRYIDLNSLLRRIKRECSIDEENPETKDDFLDIAYIKSRFPNQAVERTRYEIYGDDPSINAHKADYDTFLQFKQLGRECNFIQDRKYSYFDRVNTDISKTEQQERFNALRAESRDGREKEIHFPGVRKPISFLHKYKSYSYEEYILSKSEMVDALQIKHKYIRELINESRDLSSNEILINALKETGAKSSMERLPRVVPFLNKTTGLTNISIKDFFESNLELLNKPDCQNYILINLFSPFQLAMTFNGNPNFGEELHNFFQAALRYHSRNKQLTDGGVLLFKLGYFLKKNCHYLPKMEWLDSQEEQLRKFIKQAEVSGNKNQESKLHRILLLTTLSGSRTLYNFNLVDIFSAMFKLSEPDYLMDIEVLRTVQKNKDRLLSAFKIYSEEQQIKIIQNSIPQEYQHLKILDIKFPTVLLEGDLKLNLILGKIDSSVGMRIYLPLAITSNDKFKKLFGTNIHEAMKRVEGQNTIYEFKTNNEKFRLIQEANGEIHFQRSPPGEKNWFEWVDVRDIKVINDRYKDQDCTWWREINKEKADCPADYCVSIKPPNEGGGFLLKVERTPNLQKCWVLNPETGQPSHYIYLYPQEKNNAELYAIFEKIETQSQISIFKSVDKEKKPFLKIVLDRYGLEFHGNYNDQGILEFTLSHDPNYKLIFDEPRQIENFDHMLYMVNVHTNEKMTLVPRQEFYIEDISQKEGEYYALSYDIANKIPERISRDKNTTQAPSRHSQKFDIYKIKENKLTGNTPEENLQLAYLYLANHDPENALQALRRCKEIGLKGTETEIHFILKIMEGIPNRDHNLEHYDKGKTNEPETIAIRLMAATLLAEQKKRNFNKLTQDRNYEPSTQNGNFLREKIKTFYNEGFYSELNALYQDYRKVQGFVPEHMQLQNEDRLILLQNLDPSVMTEAMQYEHTLLEFMVAQKNKGFYLKKAKQLESQNQKMKPADIKEMKSLDETIQSLKAALLKMESQNPTEEIISVFSEEVLEKVEKGSDIIDMTPLLPEVISQSIPWHNLDLQKSILEIEHKLKREYESADLSRLKDKPFEERQKEKIRLEKLLGHAENQAKTSKKTLYLNTLTKQKRLEIKEQSEKLISQIDLKTLEDKLLQLANVEISKKIKEHVGLRKRLTLGDLILLYMQGDQALFEQKTNIKDPSVLKDLYLQIHDYLLQATRYQKYERILGSLKTLDKVSDHALQEPSHMEELVKVGNEVVSKREFDPRVHPEMLAFEYFENTLIRKDQVRVIASISEKEKTAGFKNKIVQLIMGFGKSKLLLPIMALKRADGTNLSMIEIPQALFTSSFADLSAITQRLFGKKGFPLLFNRDTDCNAKNLHAVYEGLQLAMRNRDYVAVTPESLLSLELKYLEILDKDPGVALTMEEKNQIMYLEKILTLIRTKGDVLIDECDSALAYDKELNYTFGQDPKPMPEHLISATLEIFDLFKQVQLTDQVSKEKQERFTLEDVMLGKRTIATKEGWTKAFISLAETILHSRPGPLDFISKDHHETVMQYLLNKTPNVPELIKEYSPKQQEFIDLVKGELELLKICLQKKPGVDFGFPKREDYEGCKELAIPYLANGIPNYRAKKSLYETMLLTLILQKRKVATSQLSPNLIERLIHHFTEMANKEISDRELEDEVLPFENTKAAYEFAQLTGLPLEKTHFTPEIVKTLSANPKVFHYIMKKFVLSENKEHQSVLKANRINHFSQFRSGIGVAGTPGKAQMYHRDLAFDEIDGIGIDGITMDHLIAKKTNVELLPNKNPEVIIKNNIIHHPRADKIHAFLDIGAIFEGWNNLDIAILLAKALKEKAGNKIEYVLFFNEEGQLSALPVSSVEGKPVLLIGSTDPKRIYDITKCTPDKLFTYYDQTNTTGIDIRQTPDAIGVATVDLNTQSRDCWQGVMRLRGLPDNQAIEFILPDSVRALKPDKDKWGVEDVIDLVETSAQISEINLKVALANMDDVVRNYCLERINLCRDPQEKLLLRKQFSEAFEMQMDPNPTKKFRGAEISEDTESILQNHIRKCLEKISRLDHNLMVEDKAAIERTLANIKKTALRNTTTKSTITFEADKDLELELEKEREKEKEKDKEREREKETWEKSIIASPSKSWKGKFPTQLNVGVYPGSLVNILHISNMLGYNPGFSKDIYFSENFVNTYEGQKNKMDRFIKPLQFFMAIQDKSGGVQILCVTQEEAEEFAAHIKSQEGKETLAKEGKEAWIISTHNTLVCGTSDPPNSQEYRTLLGQIQYFNGDIDLLIKSKNLDWILENNTQEKLNILKEVILKNYPEKALFWDLFNRRVNKLLAEKAQVPGTVQAEKEQVPEGKEKEKGGVFTPVFQKASQGSLRGSQPEEQVLPPTSSPRKPQ